MFAALLYVGFVIGIGYGAGIVLGHVFGHWRTDRQRTDPALHIKPPRRYTDRDGRSDFRPELPEQLEYRRRTASGMRR